MVIFMNILKPLNIQNTSLDIKLINNDDQAFIKYIKENKIFLTQNQGNQCFATSAFYLLFSQAPFRHAVTGTYVAIFRTAFLIISLDNRNKSDIAKLLWNVLATQNDDVNWVHCLLSKLSEELGDGKQKDQHEMLTLLLEKLQEVILNYFVKFRTICKLSFRRIYYHRGFFTPSAPQPSSVHHACMRLQMMYLQILLSLQESLLMRKNKIWTILSKKSFLVQMPTVQSVTRRERLSLCIVPQIQDTLCIQISS